MTVSWQSLTIQQLHPLMLRGEISPVELTQGFLDRISQFDDTLHCYITVEAQQALAQAQEATRRLASGRATPLTGIPLAIKDLIVTQGLRTTCASRSLENYVPPYDATVMHRLREAGAVILGKVNMDEFAMGSSTENSAFGATRNPWRLDCIPGGSSGGSAAAVAADLCLASLGSDTGGSIRQPASHCGVVGLKPTYGRVSRFGLVAFASSLDQIGPITKDVADCALLLQFLAGYDPKDSTSAPVPTPDYSQALNQDIKGLKIGVPQEYFIAGMEEEVEQAVRAALETFKGLGAELVEVSLPHTQYAVAVYYLIATAEASSNLARYDGVKYGFRAAEANDLMDMYCATRAQGLGAEVRRRIMLGTYALSAGYYDAYYKKASQVRTLIRRDFDEVFQTCQIVATPVAPTTAFRLGEKMDDPLTMYLSDIFTISANLAGIPGISVPCGLNSGGLPIGLQLLARHFDESTLLKAAHAFEQASTFHLLKPPI
ncbi:Asp-tRNA(Asn)/Glu-tRNA(Gln) amidotransferase subunit GatA [Desulfobacca acetoxidans]|uniref:Glutamyl-tRNA(Gln) amidotransferase subunit A n=1 Tax=Desulfobacca acetoxidans (strain ATCC 700848 / DSM 11109 / ASRB2) TaxID=880072 RepID=F2NF15_DESAR|nr:Asp-tRNA(Asn)/Glu-tRNA(Gln) amidotransferase subunit GatA [Desulfobacca acetoxidans]AEB08355.1 Glutamyl-tRNA(Gln) amidotransferase subunit A [Desulfobacca acetoxidans DSM 11109]